MADRLSLKAERVAKIPAAAAISDLIGNEVVAAGQNAGYDPSAIWRVMLAAILVHGNPIAAKRFPGSAGGAFGPLFSKILKRK